MKKGDKVGLVCCSNAQMVSQKENIDALEAALRNIGLIPVFSDYIYEKDSVFGGTAKERTKALMDFYEDETIRGIFDISGGDIANEILPFLDFEVIAESDKLFYGYSDLTTIINAIYTKTGKSSVLYQVRNLIGEHGKKQISDFSNTILEGGEELFSFEYRFVQGEQLQGTVVGGNIRCLLKLAGTEYFPDVTDKILFLEARSGRVPQMVTFLNQLKQMRVFDNIKGIVLGTFSKMEGTHCVPDIETLVKQYAGAKLPMVKTQDIGHGSDSKALLIGRTLDLKKFSGHFSCKL